jgi:hypothetical protein
MTTFIKQGYLFYVTNYAKQNNLPLATGTFIRIPNISLQNYTPQSEYIETKTSSEVTHKHALLYVYYFIKKSTLKHISFQFKPDTTQCKLSVHFRHEIMISFCILECNYCILQEHMESSIFINKFNFTHLTHSSQVLCHLFSLVVRAVRHTMKPH